LHEDVLKMPHHGSDRNVDRAFLSKVTADAYVVSANGQYGNPDVATLEWLLAAAKQGGRHFKLYVTNEPMAVKQFITQYPPRDNNYDLVSLPIAKRYLSIPIA